MARSMANDPKRRHVFEKMDDNQRVGVIDIGSNSVRLVIYDVLGRCIRVFFNEKVLAGLGRGLGETGRLNSEGVGSAMRALERFCAVMEGQRVQDIRPFATAAVREAEDGAAFCAEVRERTGLKIRILSGAEEARFAAMGVIAMQPKADGICGDLGGTSLELSHISSGYYTGGSTYALGPLALAPVLDGGDISEPAVRSRLESHIDSVFASAPELQGRTETFYAVGGAWRAIARIHMELTNYPLRVLQNYEMDIDSLSKLCDQLWRPDKKLTHLINVIGKKRETTLPITGVVLKKLLNAGGFKRVIMSSHGAREGMVYDGLPPTLKACDPLLEGMRLLMRPEPAGALFGEALSDWIRQPAEKTLSRRLVEAACLVADIGARLHPDHRSQTTFDWVMTAPVTGVTHVERTLIAYALGCRYERTFRDTASELLLDGRQRVKARALGALMRLGADFAGRTATLFDNASLWADDHRLVLEIEESAASLASELVVKRLQRAADVIGLEPEVRIRGVEIVSVAE